jgi:hypothetical protein
VDYRTPEDGSAVQVDPQQVHDFVQGVAGTPTATPATATPDNHAITVDVRNASGRTGLAAAVVQDLAGKGFTGGDTANSTSRTTSVIRVPTGQQAAGKAVADALGSSAAVEVDGTVTADHVTVFLGTDYSGQAASAAANPTSAPAQPDPAADRTITASGVTCVN